MSMTVAQETQAGHAFLVSGKFGVETLKLVDEKINVATLHTIPQGRKCRFGLAFSSQSKLTL